VTNTVKNVGDAPATAAFSVGFGLVPVAPAGSEIPLAETRPAGPLGAQVASSATTPVVIPFGTAAGTYKIVVRADALGDVPTDPGSQNNTRLTNTLTVVLPDLVVSSLGVSATTGFPGGMLDVTHALRNVAASPAHAPASTSRIYLAANQSVAAAVAVLGNVSAPAVSAGVTTASLVAGGRVIPVDTPPGRYFIVVEANADRAFGEASTANNVRASATPVLVGPDLVLTAASVTPTGVTPGANLSVTFTAKNQGGSAAPFDVGLALVPVTSTGVPTGGSPVELGVIASLTLNPGQSVTPAATSIAVPTTIDAGRYKVRLTADPGNAVAEADETNNVILTTAIVTVAKADLTVRSVTFTPPAAGLNGSVTLTHTVRNLAASPGHAPASRSRLFLSPVNTGPGGFDLGTVAVPPITAGASATVSATLPMPPGITPGAYYALAVANDGGTVIEPPGAGTNNFGASLTRLLVGPDLTPTSASAAAGVAAGMNLSVAYSVKNVGGEGAGPFEVALRLVPVTAVGVPTGDPEIALGTRALGGLAAGASQAFSDKAPVPAATTAGSYKVRVVVDHAAAVTEADETNNERLTGLVKIARPDFTVTSVRFTPAAVASGANVSVTHTVKNVTTINGNAPASQSAIYLSQNASFAGVLAQLATVNVPALASSGAATLVRTVNIGNLSTGLYFFVVRADDPDAVIEQNDGNNIGISGGLIVGPDPAITALSVTPAALAPGANLSITASFANLGASVTGDFEVDYVLVPVNPTGPETALTDITDSLNPVGTAGATKTRITTATLPSGLAAGQYQIRATLVPSTAEADPGNDIRLSNAFSVVRPDLVMSVFTPPATLIAGRTASLTNTVKNNATASGAAAPFRVGVYFSSTSTTDTTGDTLVGNRSVTGLAGGGTSSVPVVITVPSTSGNFFLKAFADFTDVVVEANESNNVTVKPVAVVPDLVRSNALANITFNISGSPPTCLLSISGSGAALETITTQTGGSFSGGKITFFDSQGGSDTISFSGTVTAAGNVGGTFTLSRVGGGGGSGSGSFTGTGAVGTPGSLTLNLAGTFTVSGGGTCGVTALVIFGSGPLTSPTVVPDSLVAGTYSNVTVGFGTSSPWPADGRLLIAFPAGFEIVGASLVSASGPNGSFFTSTSGQTLTLNRLGDGSAFMGSASITFSGSFGGIRNPGISGTTGTFSVSTTLTDGLTVVNSGTAPAVTITPGVLLNPTVTPASLVAGAVNNVNLEFTSSNLWPGDGTFRVVFPAGFDVSGASLLGSSGPNGTFSIAVSGQTVTLTRIGGGDPFGGSASIALSGVRNPTASGTTGTFSFTTTTAGGAAIDTGTAPGVTLTTGALTSPSVVPATLVASSITNVDVSFGTANPWPGDGMLLIDFPAGFDVSGASVVGETGPDGTFGIGIAGQTVTLTRSGGSTFSGSASITLGGIQNPSATGTTGPFSLTTTLGGGSAIDVGTAAPVTITP
jgi:subtilase family serine protease